jgi:3-hydroxyisobutyrate dehydrogenase-like beta-hydroxyacid dehydrogenase
VTRVTLIGFGEAGQSIAKGLISEGHSKVTVYDVTFNRDGGENKIEVAREYGVEPARGMSEAITNANVVLSTVVASVARDVASEAAQHIKAKQFYIDLNSVSPGLKRQMAELFRPNVNSFVEGAVMARVGADGHRTPILVAGPAADAASKLLNGVGMKTEVIGEAVGQASANKMVRSIFMKGISALLSELLVAADRYDITDRILESLSKTFPTMNWPEVASYYLGRAAIHGVRMGSEMAEVGETLKDVKLNPIMAHAIGERISWMGSQLKGHRWPEGEPKTYQEILDAIAHTTATMKN